MTSPSYITSLDFRNFRKLGTDIGFAYVPRIATHIYAYCRSISSDHASMFRTNSLNIHLHKYNQLNHRIQGHHLDTMNMPRIF